MIFKIFLDWISRILNFNCSQKTSKNLRKISKFETRSIKLNFHVISKSSIREKISINFTFNRSFICCFFWLSNHEIAIWKWDLILSGSSKSLSDVFKKLKVWFIRGTIWIWVNHQKISKKDQSIKLLFTRFRNLLNLHKKIDCIRIKTVWKTLNPVRIQTEIANIASKNHKKSCIKKFEM
jgi:hypothetical protein